MAAEQVGVGTHFFSANTYMRCTYWLLPISFSIIRHYQCQSTRVRLVHEPGSKNVLMGGGQPV